VLFRIRHRLDYLYDSPALLGPQVLRLRPREDGSQRLLDQRLEIGPLPSLLSRQLDENGNVEHRAWFVGATSSLAIESECAVETLRVNPFDFILDGAWARLPYSRAFALRHPSLEACLGGETAPAAAALAQKLCSEANQEPMAFLLRLNRWIFEHLGRERREEGPARAADDTLARQSGSCRDVAQLFIAACRSLGLPARFVSGYYEGDPGTRTKDLHAWAEAYIPGGGWRGFDPSAGLAVADRHVPLCSAPAPEGAALLSGVFGAAEAGSTLKAEVLFL
jgi:transglutaminase-like putative cysteine protease